MGNKVGDLTDIVDLDYNNKKLWDYQIETLKYWASLGVDMAKGFYEIHTIYNKDIVIASYKLNEKKLTGIFNLGKESGEIVINAVDGKYTNLVNGTVVIVN